MAKVLTDVSEFTVGVTVPQASDALTAASVEIGFQSLANRTKYLKDTITGAFAALGSDDVGNESGVPGASVSEALDQLDSDVGGAYLLDGSRALTAALNANGQDIGTTGTPAGDGYFSGNITVSGTVDGVDVSAHAAAAAPHTGVYALDGSRALTAALNANGQDVGTSGTPAGTVYTNFIAMQASARIDLVQTAIPDSTAIQIPSVGQGLLKFFTNDLAKPAGTLFYRSTTSPSNVHLIEVCGVANQHLLNIVTGDTVLSGTTGAAGKLNVSAGDTSLYFESQLGGIIYLSYLRITY